MSLKLIMLPQHGTTKSIKGAEVIKGELAGKQSHSVQICTIQIRFLWKKKEERREAPFLVHIYKWMVQMNG